MMRVVFFVLLVTNLLFAAWLISVSPARAPEPPPIPDDVPRLELLSERDPPQAQTPDQQQEARLAQPGARLCFTVGSFPTEADARRLTERLSSRLVDHQLNRGQTETEIGHWVYLPAFQDRESAMMAARRLADAGLRDYYVITVGDQENTISLGLYRDPENAESRVQHLRRLGFDARRKVRTERVPRYRVQLVLAGDEMPDWASLLSDHEDVTARETDCPDRLARLSELHSGSTVYSIGFPPGGPRRELPGPLLQFADCMPVPFFSTPRRR